MVDHRGETPPHQQERDMDLAAPVMAVAAATIVTIAIPEENRLPVLRFKTVVGAMSMHPLLEEGVEGIIAVVEDMAVAGRRAMAVVEGLG